MEFEIKLTDKDMYRFNMYQMYSGFHGWLSVILAVFVFVVGGVTCGEVETSRTVLYVVFGILFLIYPPLSLWLAAKRALAASAVLQGTLHYLVDEKGFTVSQSGESAKLPWKSIYKMVATKSNVLVYSNRRNAYVIPRAQLGEQYGDLAKLANDKLAKYRVKMK